MDSDSNDTDTLIALVASIVNDQIPQLDTSDILNALIQCDADVERAASLLIKNNTDSSTSSGSELNGKTTTKKRKIYGLDAWLHAPTSKKPVSRDKTPVSTHKRIQDASSRKESTDISNDLHKVSTINASSPSTTPSSSSIFQKPVDLMSVLRQPITSPKKANPSSSTSPVKRKPKPPSSVPRLPPLTLPSPALVAQHTPCTLHFSVLPPELACKLFYTMVDLASGNASMEGGQRENTGEGHRGWKRNKWWLFDRMVESPHRTAFFVRKDLDAERSAIGDDADIDKGKRKESERWAEAAQFWYNGTPTDPPPTFPDAMEEACYIIERVVNGELRKRKAWDMEWRPPDSEASDSLQAVLWRANVAASNCYEGGKENVGWHSDQLTYLGPYPTIASLSLGTRRVFSLRDVVPAHEQEKRHARTFNIPLPHNSLIIMHASTQERFKHSIPPQRAVDIYKPLYPRSAFWKTSSSTSESSGQSMDDDIEPSNIRINITFRFYRPDFRPENTPHCKCGVPMVLRPDMRNTIMTRDKPPSRSGSSSEAAHASEGVGGRKNAGEADDVQGYEMKYWWSCYAHAQNEGKGCGQWKVMDMRAEGRGWKDGL